MIEQCERTDKRVAQYFSLYSIAKKKEKKKEKKERKKERKKDHKANNYGREDAVDKCRIRVHVLVSIVANGSGSASLIATILRAPPRPRSPKNAASTASGSIPAPRTLSLDL